MSLSVEEWEFKLEAMGPFAPPEALKIMLKLAPADAPSLPLLSEWITNGEIKN